MRIVSIGEVLWDVIEGTDHLGGAPFNVAAHAARLGHDVRFISAVGEDERGARVLQRMTELGLDATYVRRVAEHGTGIVTVMFVDGQPQFTIHRPAAYDDAALSDNALAEIGTWSPDSIYFGTLAQTSAGVRQLLTRVTQSSPKARKFYDVNLRRGCYTPELVLDLMRAAHVVKLNDIEQPVVAQFIGFTPASNEDFCRTLAERFQMQGVCVTRGAEGCALWLDRQYVEAPAFPVEIADTVGSGDAFSAALVHGIGEGWELSRIAEFCNRLGALVASRRGAIPAWTVEEVAALKA